MVFTSLGKFVFMDYLNWRFPYIALTILAWAVYIVLRKKANPGILHYWGFRTNNFLVSFKAVLPFGLFAIATFFVVGYYQQTLNLSWHVLPICLIYPVWGVIQQFLVMSLVTGNLNDMDSFQLPRSGTIFISALIFGFIHYPYWWLVLATFVLALFYGYVFLKNRNVWVLGIFHGVLGGLFFYTVVNRDPFIEVFGNAF